MTRRTLFAGLGAGALVLAALAGGGVAFAVVQGQNPPDDSGDTRTPSEIAAASSSASASATPSPSVSAETDAATVGILPMSQRMRAREPGDVLVTAAMLTAWAADHPHPGDTPPTAAQVDAGVKAQAYETSCMWKLGDYWDPRIDYAHAREATAGGLNGIPEKILLDYYGTNLHDGSTDYVWQDAGCNGAAIHYFLGDRQG